MNFKSEEWKEVAAHIEGDIKRLTESICADQPEAKTQAIRGQIAYARALLRWPEQGIPPIEGVDFGI